MKSGTTYEKLKLADAEENEDNLANELLEWKFLQILPADQQQSIIPANPDRLFQHMMDSSNFDIY